MYAPDPDEKFDFQNMDVKLYLALQAVVKEQDEFVADHGPFSVNPENLLNAKRALYEFQQSFGPVPDWAVVRNFGLELVEGAQLFTKNGRRCGNAWIVELVTKENPSIANSLNPYGEYAVYQILTDAGSLMQLTEQELESAFEVGDWISTRERIISDFDRNKEFAKDGN